MRKKRKVNHRELLDSSAIIKAVAESVQEVVSRKDTYALGVLLHDAATQQYINRLAPMQAIAMQSMQINHPKRALRYLAAIRKLRKANVLSELQIKKDITAQLLARQNDLK